MTTLRQAAQQALEAMDQLHRTGDTQVFDLCHKETTEALRAALAEPVQEPVACNPLCELCVKRGYDFCANVAKTTPIIICPPQRKPIDVDALGIPHGQQFQPAQKQEPVYWEVRCTAHPKWMRVDEQQFDEYVANGWEGQRLYTAPPQRKPLTDEEIDWMTRGNNYPGTVPGARRFARAVEAAHGIKEKK